VWLVDNLKIFHVEKDRVKNVTRQLTNKFGKDSPLTTSRRKVFDYLEIKIDYRRK